MRIQLISSCARMHHPTRLRTWANCWRCPQRDHISAVSPPLWPVVASAFPFGPRPVDECEQVAMQRWLAAKDYDPWTPLQLACLAVEPPGVIQRHVRRGRRQEAKAVAARAVKIALVRNVPLPPCLGLHASDREIDQKVCWCSSRSTRRP